MDDALILQELEDLAQHLGVDLQYDEMEGQGR